LFLILLIVGLVIILVYKPRNHDPGPDPGLDTLPSGADPKLGYGAGGDISGVGVMASDLEGGSSGVYPGGLGIGVGKGGEGGWGEVGSIPLGDDDLA
jgi:hypothetical protein